VGTHYYIHINIYNRKAWTYTDTALVAVLHKTLDQEPLWPNEHADWENTTLNCLFSPQHTVRISVDEGAKFDEGTKLPARSG